jgi:hypothetical protein
VVCQFRGALLWSKWSSEPTVLWSHRVNEVRGVRHPGLVQARDQLPGEPIWADLRDPTGGVCQPAPPLPPPRARTTHTAVVGGILLRHGDRQAHLIAGALHYPRLHRPAAASY